MSAAWQDVLRTAAGSVRTTANCQVISSFTSLSNSPLSSAKSAVPLLRRRLIAGHLCLNLTPQGGPACGCPGDKVRGRTKLMWDQQAANALQTHISPFPDSVPGYCTFGCPYCTFGSPCPCTFSCLDPPTLLYFRLPLLYFRLPKPHLIPLFLALCLCMTFVHDSIVYLGLNKHTCVCFQNAPYI
jgi:hypothetical protein